MLSGAQKRASASCRGPCRRSVYLAVGMAVQTILKPLI